MALLGNGKIVTMKELCSHLARGILTLQKFPARIRVVCLKFRSSHSFCVRPPSRFLAGPPIVESRHVCDGKNAPLKTKSAAKANAKAAVILSLSQNAPAARKDFFHRDSGGTGRHRPMAREGGAIHPTHALISYKWASVCISLFMYA